MAYPKFISLAIKNAIVYFILTLAGLAGLSYLLFQNSAREIVESSERQVQQAAEIVDVKFASFIKNVQRDILFLAQSPFLNDFLVDPNDHKKQLLSSEYFALLKSKPDYAQIRLIGSENSGKELIRVERQAKQTFLVDPFDLQQKGNRSYFKKTVQLPKDSVFLSVIDLNKEYGKISQPLMPTLRVASPVFRADEIFGIVVINVNLESFFKELNDVVSESFQLKLVNDEGYFLLHPDKEKTFGFEFGKPADFEGDFDKKFFQVQLQIRNNSLFWFKENELLYVFKPLFYPKADYHLFVTVGSSKATILADFYTWRSNVLFSTFGLAVFILLVILIYMQRQANELKRITRTMTRFPGQIDREQLPVSRNDEIGQLAKQFKDMSLSIDKNIHALKLAKKKVEQAVKDKDTFLENMSHEIRNPVHSIIGMTHLLERNNPGHHQKAFIEALKFNSNNLLSLVNDILDFKKLSSGDLKVKPQWLGISDFLPQIADSHQFSAATKKIKMTVDVDKELSNYLVFTDPVRLTQIINNLVVNAIKFTPINGEVHIKSKLLEKQSDQLNIRIAVSDTGIGIAKDKVEEIVKRYYFQDTRDNIIPEGSGLGLPIVIQLLKLFDTQLSIDSIPDKGSHFYFDLNVPAKLQTKKEKNQQLKLPIALLQKTRVLVMDDDELVLLLYENLFKDKVASFVKTTKVDVVKELEDHTVDILITDLNFEQQQLFEFQINFSRILKKEGLLFVVSGSDLDDNKVKRLPQFKAQFRKPINPSQLLEALTLAFADQQFGTPDVSPFWEDYDHEEEKFRRVIHLLLNEWEKMASTLELLIDQQDMKGYTAVRHKLITSVRRLRLDSFETLLNIPLQEKEKALTPEFKTKVDERMNYYLWWLKNKV